MSENKRLTPMERNQLIIELVDYDTYKHFQGGDEFHEKLLTLIKDYNIAASKLDTIETGPGPEESSHDFYNSLFDVIFGEPHVIQIVDPSKSGFVPTEPTKKNSGRYPFKKA